MKYFTPRQGFFLYSFEFDEEELEKLTYFLELLEKSNVFEAIEKSLTKHNYQGRHRTDAYNMLATVIYAFMMENGELRDIERSCKISLDYMYLMNGEKVSYVTFANFINKIIIPNIDEIYKRIINTIVVEANINIDDIYIDGSKFEANANKYKFVWKPDKKLKKLKTKISEILQKYSITLTEITYESMLEAINNLKTIGSKQKIDLDNIKRGKGNKLNEIEKDYISIKEYLDKFLIYQEQINICGDNRNSYYKTDHDATAMCLKQDYYSGLGSNMHAAYNVQLIIAQGFIIGVYVSQDRNDYQTLNPCIEKYKEYFGKYPLNVCADSGYGSYDNYKYIESKGINNYIKYSLWSGEREGKTPQLFKVEDDKVNCLNNKIGEKVTVTNRHPKSQYASFYKFKGCKKCEYKSICKKRMKNKSQSYRIAEINIEYLRYIQEARKNLLSVKGIEFRINRSIQTEGNFGNLKQNESYSRFRRRGMEKSSAEIMLKAIGVDIKKYIRFKITKQLPKFWKAPNDLQPEAEPTVKIPKNPQNKTKSVNQKSKDDYKKKYRKGPKK